MAIPSTVERYLDAHRIAYDVVPHDCAYTSLGAAAAANVEPDRVAKAVLLEDEDGYVLAVVPATCHLKLRAIRRQTGRDVHLATEGEVRECFPDCDAGAVPALGPAYGVDTIWDDALMERSDVYFDAGDHERLLHVSTRDFADMLARGWHGRFGKRFLA